MQWLWICNDISYRLLPVLPNYIYLYVAIYLLPMNDIRGKIYGALPMILVRFKFSPENHALWYLSDACRFQTNWILVYLNSLRQYVFSKLVGQKVTNKKSADFQEWNSPSGTRLRWLVVVWGRQIEPSIDEGWFGQNWVHLFSRQLCCT